MKHQWFLALGLIVVLNSCGKIPPEGEPIVPDSEYNTFQLIAYVSDSVGNSLLPYPLEDYPYLDPFTFYATDEWGNDIGQVATNSYTGYSFIMKQEWTEIISKPSYKKDSIFEIYPCFGGDCDTVFIYKRRMGRTDVNRYPYDYGCYIDWYSYKGDTVHEMICEFVPLYF